jgi:hypothetical protein
MKRNKLFVAIIAAWALNGCTMFAPKTPIAKMATEYTVITGVLVAPVELKNGNHRMIIYFNEAPEELPEVKDKIMRDANGEIATDTDGKVVKTPETPSAAKKNVLMCVAANDSNKEVLVNLREYLNDPKAQGKTIFIYGTPINGAWNEYLSGVHCSIKAIGFFIPTTGAYTYILTAYGDGVWDNFSWTEFLKKVGSAAVDKAL